MVPAHGMHFPRQNSALRVLLRAPGDLQRRVKQLTDSQDTPCTESLLVINNTRTAHVDHQSGSAHQHCEFPHFPDHAPSHACRKSPNGLRETCPIIVAVARKIHIHAGPSLTTINRVCSLLKSITSDQKQHIAQTLPQSIQQEPNPTFQRLSHMCNCLQRQSPKTPALPTLCNRHRTSVSSPTGSTPTR